MAGTMKELAGISIIRPGPINQYIDYAATTIFIPQVNMKKTSLSLKAGCSRVAWYVPQSSTAPVYRVNGDYHFYTASSAERDYLVARGWRNEVLHGSYLPCNRPTVRNNRLLLLFSGSVAVFSASMSRIAIA